jgi:hypothetical protein
MLQNALIGYWTEKITKAIRSISIEHANIHEGISFSAFNKSTILAGATLLFSFKTPSTGYVHYRPAGIYPSGDNINLDLYEGATINVAGTPLIVNNRNRISSSVALSQLRVGTTFSANGTLIDGLSTFLPGTTGAGQTRSGNISNGTDEIVLKQNTVYRLACINGSSASNTIGFNFNWYEEGLE